MFHKDKKTTRNNKKRKLIQSRIKFSQMIRSTFYLLFTFECLTVWMNKSSGISAGETSSHTSKFRTILKLDHLFHSSRHQTNWHETRWYISSETTFCESYFFFIIICRPRAKKAKIAWTILLALRVHFRCAQYAKVFFGHKF